MRSRLRSYLATAALAAVAGACGSDSSTGPTPTVRADLGEAFAELGHPALNDALDGLTGLFIPPGPNTGCPYAAASQAFVCPTQTQSGLSLAFSYALLDASGGTQSAFGPTTTNAVRTKAVVSGTTTELGTPLTINGQQELTVSGLLSTKHTLNGASTFHLTGSITTPGGSLPIAYTSKITITNVVLPSTVAGASPWPASGTILAEETMDGTGATNKSLVTFNGTGKISLVFTSETGHVTNCTMDLARGGEATCSG
jgi:hypothetical protein